MLGHVVIESDEIDSDMKVMTKMAVFYNILIGQILLHSTW